MILQSCQILLLNIITFPISNPFKNINDEKKITIIYFIKNNYQHYLHIINDIINKLTTTPHDPILLAHVNNINKKYNIIKLIYIYLCDILCNNTITAYIDSMRYILTQLLNYILIYLKKEEKKQTFINKIISLYLPIIKSTFNKIYVCIAGLVACKVLSSAILDHFILTKFALCVSVIESIYTLCTQFDLKKMLDNFHPNILFNYLVANK